METSRICQGNVPGAYTCDLSPEVRICFPGLLGEGTKTADLWEGRFHV